MILWYYHRYHNRKEYLKKKLCKVESSLKVEKLYDSSTGVTNLFYKGPDGNYFRLCGPKTCSTKAARDDMWIKEPGCVPRKLFRKMGGELNLAPGLKFADCCSSRGKCECPWGTWDHRPPPQPNCLLETALWVHMTSTQLRQIKTPTHKVYLTFPFGNLVWTMNCSTNTHEHNGKTLFLASSGFLCVWLFSLYHL